MTVNENTATGTLYCLTYLFSTQNGKKFKQTIGVRYSDQYALVNGRWLISRRESFFEWQTNEEVKGQP